MKSCRKTQSQPKRTVHQWHEHSAGCWSFQKYSEGISIAKLIGNESETPISLNRQRRSLSFSNWMSCSFWTCNTFCKALGVEDIEDAACVLQPVATTTASWPSDLAGLGKPATSRAAVLSTQNVFVPKAIRPAASSLKLPFSAASSSEKRRAGFLFSTCARARSALGARGMRARSALETDRSRARGALAAGRSCGLTWAMSSAHIFFLAKSKNETSQLQTFYSMYTIYLRLPSSKSPWAMFCVVIVQNNTLFILRYVWSTRWNEKRESLQWNNLSKSLDFFHFVQASITCLTSWVDRVEKRVTMHPP